MSGKERPSGPDRRLRESGIFSRTFISAGGASFDQPWMFKVLSPNWGNRSGVKRFYVFQEGFRPPSVRDAEGNPRPELGRQIYSALDELHPVLFATKLIGGVTSRALEQRIREIDEDLTDREERPFTITSDELVQKLAMEREDLRLSRLLVKRAEDVLAEGKWTFQENNGMPVRRDGRGRPKLLLSYVVERLAPPLQALAPEGRKRLAPVRLSLSHLLQDYFPSRYTDPVAEGLLDKAIKRLE